MRATFLPIGRAGFVEAATIQTASEALYSPSLREISPISIGGAGVVGFLSAGTLGSIVATRGYGRVYREASTGKRFREGAKELGVRTVEYASYAVDPFEKISDISYEALERGAARVTRVRTIQPSVLSIGRERLTLGVTEEAPRRTKATQRAPTESIIQLPTEARIRKVIKVPTTTRGMTPTSIPALTKTPTTIREMTRTQQLINIPTPTLTTTPTPTQTLIQTELVTNVPVITPQVDIPLFAGQFLGMGDRPEGGLGRKRAYTPNIAGLLTGETLRRAPKGLFTGFEVRRPVRGGGF
jgi:hypothetical protein